MPSDYAKDFIQKCLKIVPATNPILDVGSADFAYWYCPFFPDMEYKTLDPDPKYKNVVDYNFNVCDYPPSFKEKFGMVLMLETLEHVANPFCAFKAINAILKPGGYLILTTVACFALHSHPNDYWRFLPDGLNYLCHTAGLRVLTNKLSQPDTTRQSHIALLAQKRQIPDAILTPKDKRKLI